MITTTLRHQSVEIVAYSSGIYQCYADALEGVDVHILSSIAELTYSNLADVKQIAHAVCNMLGWTDDMALLVLFEGNVYDAELILAQLEA